MGHHLLRDQPPSTQARESLGVRPVASFLAGFYLFHWKLIQFLYSTIV